VEEFPDFPEARDCCLEIVEFLSATPYEFCSHLTFVSIDNLTGNKWSPQLIGLCVGFLITPSLNALCCGFEFIDDDGGQYVLDQEDVELSTKEGVLIHPITGEAVKDPSNKVYPFFYPGDAFK
jgi:hypothetical protein